ncbi:MAG: hypothetical protein IJH41_06935 [Eubacterium sp.]|nr:hypothetical protein [Eubacterium sp.]
MKTLEEYKKEIEQDPKARHRLKKLEKEFQSVEENLTEEELVKYGLKPAEEELKPAEDDLSASDGTDAADSNSKAGSVIDLISRKL